MSLARRALSLGIGAAAALVGGALAWTAVGITGFRAWKDGAFVAGPEVVLVVAAAVIAGALAAVLAWRALVGPPLERIEWTLVWNARPASGEPATRRATVGDLLGTLTPLGYSLDTSFTDDAGRPLRAAAPADPLAGTVLQLRDSHPAGRRGHVLLRIPPERAPDAMALGFVDVHGALDGLYDELGRYAIAALGRLHPELTFKRMDSGLAEESAAGLWSELPERPERLG